MRLNLALYPIAFAFACSTEPTSSALPDSYDAPDVASGETSSGDAAPDSTDAPAEPGAPSRQTVGADAWLSCALERVDTPSPVACWGQFSSVVLSTPAPIGATPKRTAGLDDAVNLDVDSDHVCAVRVGGEVVCWGFNHHGQLGLPKDDVFHPGATAVAGITTAVQVTVGGSHSCALLADGHVDCWGMAAWGQLGSTEAKGLSESASPVRVQDVAGAVKIAAGDGHTCALLDDETVRCWGFNPFGELGHAASDEPTTAGLPALFAGVGPVRDIALAGHATWALGHGGEVWFAGTHQSPDSTTVPVLEQTIPGAVSIAASHREACVTDANGAVQCWNFWPVLRWGTGEPNLDPSELRAGFSGDARMTEVAIGLDHRCGRDGDGQVQCWGRGALGQLGPSVPPPSVVLDAPVLLTGASHVAAYREATCATVAGAAGGDVWCWGRNDGGRLGPGATDSELPTRVTLDGATAPADDLALGAESACVVAGGEVWCWGRNDEGQLGAPGVGAVKVPGLKDISRVVVGGRHACALREDGAVACWGENEVGQLGLGTTTALESPTWLTLPGVVVDIAAGESHTCIATKDREGYCWGFGKFGQLGETVEPDPEMLGDGGPNAYLRMYAKLTPQKLPVTDVVRIAADSDQTCTAHSTGVSCWGQGLEDTHSAVAGGDLSATALVMSPWGGCRLGAAGAACFNTFKALGAGESGDVLDGVRSVAFGSYACVVEANGDVRCYSDTDVAALAGTLEDARTPVFVPMPE